jgi:hypothetical protein
MGEAYEEETSFVGLGWDEREVKDEGTRLEY